MIRNPGEIFAVTEEAVGKALTGRKFCRVWLVLPELVCLFFIVDPFGDPDSQ